MGRLQHNHVEALNMVPVDFARSSKVIEAWREYLDILNTPEPQDEVQQPPFWRERDSKFVNLILAMSKELRYKFTRLEVEKLVYAPRAHETRAAQADALMNGVLQFVRDGKPIPVQLIGIEQPTPQLSHAFEP
jgi:hypothetical protein